jgi:hypothetical protein
MINLYSYFSLAKNKLLKIKLKSNSECLFGIFDSIGLVQPRAATPVRPTSPVNFRYSNSIESYLEDRLACKNILLNGPEIELIEIISV